MLCEALYCMAHAAVTNMQQNILYPLSFEAFNSLQVRYSPAALANFVL